MQAFQTIVAVLTGAGVIASFVVGASKIVNAVNKKCPCQAVVVLQQQVKKHTDYFSNDSKAIHHLQMEVELLKQSSEGMTAKIDEMHDDIKTMLKSGMFHGIS